MTSLIDIFGIMSSSFLLNLIPFAGPSNLFIASTIAISSQVDPLTIGFFVAFGAASAKLIHYLVTFFAGKAIPKDQRTRIDSTGRMLKRWAALALFLVAATPLPDEPVIIPLGLVKYNPAKFYLVFFAGKLSITIFGAYLGRFGRQFLSPAISPDTLTIIAIVLTIFVTIALLKIDVEKMVNRVLRRKSETSHEQVSNHE
jgi:membrane protein DedA with SNARE-associated domain